MTYARARLWIGIGSVGLLVTLSALALVAQWPVQLFSGSGGTLGSDALALAAVLVAISLLLLPSDLLGGFLAPRAFGREHPSLAGFLARWARGVSAWLVTTTLAGTAVLAAGRAGGRPGALAVLLGCMLAAAVLQAPLARLVGGLRRVSPDVRGMRGELARLLRDLPDVQLFVGDDPGFSGGIAGLGQRAPNILPERWLRELDDATVALLVARRQAIVRSGLRRRGLLVAMAWNLGGFALASLLPGAGVTSVAEIVTTALGFALWSFLGLLVLPTLSRRATYAADALVVRDELSRERMARAIHALDRLQDDEPERSRWIETIFHPLPSAGARVRALGRSPVRGAPWHVARTALFLSSVCLGFLGRAVHCNAGRPELWVFLPADG